MINLRDLFQRLDQRPSMYLPNERYFAVVAFVEGCNAATGWELLAGFNEWAASQILEHESSRHWSAIVASKFAPEILKEPSAARIPAEAEKAASKELLRLLDIFLAEKERSRLDVAFNGREGVAKSWSVSLGLSLTNNDPDGPPVNRHSDSSRSAMRPYTEIEEFSSYYLEDSYALGITARLGTLDVELDIVLTPEHPEYSAHHPGEQHCYRRGHLRFRNVSCLHWDAQGMVPARDATGEPDLGCVDSWLVEDGIRHLIVGDFGRITVVSTVAEIVLDAMN